MRDAVSMPSDDDRPPGPAEPPADEARDDFVKGVRSRGEVAAEGEELEPGQTHEAVEQDGQVGVRRRRFSVTD
jgi:hypothetical protein